MYKVSSLMPVISGCPATKACKHRPKCCASRRCRKLTAVSRRLRYLPPTKCKLWAAHASDQKPVGSCSDRAAPVCQAQTIRSAPHLRRSPTGKRVKSVGRKVRCNELLRSNNSSSTRALPSESRTEARAVLSATSHVEMSPFPCSSSKRHCCRRS